MKHALKIGVLEMSFPFCACGDLGGEKVKHALKIESLVSCQVCGGARGKPNSNSAVANRNLPPHIKLDVTLELSIDLDGKKNLLPIYALLCHPDGVHSGLDSCLRRNDKSPFTQSSKRVSPFHLSTFPPSHLFTFPPFHPQGA
ncbi:MAG: hypothetical protein PHO32_05915 [Candidatus Cloacimonetes bacterium]|nr:hypothetical protein [Candidatus Cloacimonadota bacterium]